jgi:hypothetical protein
MKTIIVSSQFAGLHQYLGAPSNVGFLRHPHRHMFKVLAEIKVSHGDRELEFFTVKEVLDSILATINERVGVWGSIPTVEGFQCSLVIQRSCEDLAEFIAKALIEELKISIKLIRFVEVSEDGENAGRYYPA